MGTRTDETEQGILEENSIATGVTLSIFLIHRVVAVAFPTRLAGRFSVKDPKKNLAGLTRTARDVGGPSVEAFGMISEHSSPLGQGRLGMRSCFGINFQMGD